MSDGEWAGLVRRRESKGAGGHTLVSLLQVPRPDLVELVVDLSEAFRATDGELQVVRHFSDLALAGSAVRHFSGEGYRRFMREKGEGS